jgi:hypothetical protein
MSSHSTEVCRMTLMSLVDEHGVTEVKQTGIY